MADASFAMHWKKTVVFHFNFLKKHFAMTTFDELSSTLQAHLNELRDDYAVSELGVFGSFVRGEQQEGSDVDMLVEFSRPVGFVTFIKLENRLREILAVCRS